MKNILIIIDVQKGFLINNETRKVAEKITGLTHLGVFDHIILTRFINHGESPCAKYLQWDKLSTYEEVTEPVDLVYDAAIDKSTYSPVNREFLNLLTETNEHKHPAYVFMCGIDTDGCVLETAVDLFDSYIRPIVLLNYCASTGGEDAHNAGVHCLSRMIGPAALVVGDVVEPQQLDDILEQVMR